MIKSFQWNCGARPLGRRSVAAHAAGLCVLLAMLVGVSAAQAERLTRGHYVYDGWQPAAASDEWRRFSGGRAARFLGWLADGTLLIATRFGASEQLHRVSMPLGARTQLSWIDGEVQGATAPPLDSAHCAFLKTDGARGAALYLQSLSDGAHSLLADAGFQPGPAAFSHDGKQLAFSDRRRDGVSDDLYVAAADGSGAARLVAAGTSAEWRVHGFTPDDHQLLTLRRDPVAGDQLALVDLATGAAHPITLAETPAADAQSANSRRARNSRSARAHGGQPAAVAPAHIADPVLSPDARGAYFLDLGGEFARLRYARLDGSDQRDLVPGFARDIGQYALSADGRYLAYAYFESGVSRLTLVDQQKQLESRLPGLPSGTITALAFDRGSQQLAIGLDTPTAPEDVFVYSLANFTLTRWTQSEPGELNPASLSRPEAIRFPTWDRPDGTPRQLDALVYRPSGGGVHGALILLGGETPGQQRYDAYIQYVVQKLGLVVVRPTLRGASGLGRSFAAMGRGDRRDDAVRDLGFLLAYLGLQPSIDRQHLIVAGSGLGAYQALAALTLYGDRLQGAIAIDGALSATQSAVITRPVLLLNGFSAAPASKADGEQLLWRLRTAGSRVWYAAADDVERGSAAARGHALELSLEFLADLIGSARGADAATAVSAR